METGFEPVYTALQAVASPLGHSTVTGPRAFRADDGIRTRDPHLGKVMRYQLRYIRAPRTTSRPSRRTTIVHKSVAAQIRLIAALRSLRTADTPRAKSKTRGRSGRRGHVIHDWALSQHSTPALIDRRTAVPRRAESDVAAARTRSTTARPTMTWSGRVGAVLVDSGRKGLSC